LLDLDHIVIEGKVGSVMDVLRFLGDRSEVKDGVCPRYDVFECHDSTVEEGLDPDSQLL
jgi:hypothetical protein